MANNYWLGTKDAVAQVSTYQITAFDATTSYKVTVNGVEVSVLGDTDEDTTATNLQVALEASTNPYFTPITWTVATDTVTGTGPAGMPFTAAGSVTGGTGTMTYTAEATAATGPNFWDEDENWSTGTAPAASDDVIIENSSINIMWGLDQNAVTLDSMRIEKSYTGKIGLKYNSVATTADGNTTDTTEAEYRDIYLKIGVTDLKIGTNFSGRSQSGSNLLKIDTASAQSNITVFDSGSTSDETNKPGIQLLTNHASTTLYVRNATASVGLATGIPFETSLLSSIEIGDGQTNGGVNVGEGVTVTTFTCKSGTHYLEAAATITTLTVDGGTVNTEGDYTITTGTVANTGTINANHIKSAGSCFTTLNINSDGTVDFLGSSEARTVSTLNFNVGGTLLMDKSIITVTTFEEPTGKFTLTAEA